MLAEESVIIISTIIGSLILIIMVVCYCVMCDTESTINIEQYNSNILLADNGVIIYKFDTVEDTIVSFVKLDR